MNKRFLKPKYQPDMLSLHRACSSNYLLLLRLIPDFDQDKYYFYHLDSACYQLHVIEQTQYTSVLSIDTIANNVSLAENVNELTPQIKVRLYHDAQMAEVLASRQIRYFKSRYDYPNRLMQQPDEKYQVNRFLGQWLKHCLEDGRVTSLNQGNS